jgi:hypothetical protein
VSCGQGRRHLSLCGPGVSGEAGPRPFARSGPPRPLPRGSAPVPVPAPAPRRGRSAVGSAAGSPRPPQGHQSRPPRGGLSPRTHPASSRSTLLRSPSGPPPLTPLPPRRAALGALPGRWDCAGSSVGRGGAGSRGAGGARRALTGRGRLERPRR